MLISKLKLKFDIISNWNIYTYTRPASKAQVNIGAFRLKVIESIDLVTFTFGQYVTFKFPNVTPQHQNHPITVTTYICRMQLHCAELTGPIHTMQFNGTIFDPKFNLLKWNSHQWTKKPFQKGMLYTNRVSLFTKWNAIISSIPAPLVVYNITNDSRDLHISTQYSESPLDGVDYSNIIYT